MGFRAERRALSGAFRPPQPGPFLAALPWRAYKNDHADFRQTQIDHALLLFLSFRTYVWPDRGPYDLRGFELTLDRPASDLAARASFLAEHALLKLEGRHIVEGAVLAGVPRSVHEIPWLRVFEGLGASHGALAVFHVIAGMLMPGGRAVHVRVPEVARELGTTPQSVRRYLRYLEADGYLEAKPVSGQPTAYRYGELVGPAEPRTDLGPAPGVGTGQEAPNVTLHFQNGATVPFTPDVDVPALIRMFGPVIDARLGEP